ncbi:SprT family protein [Enterococcus sp. LJL128]|uniref:SprT family protein n=1 Tax=Enterococcus sp. LJL51 TaxID=3416656 RepID=UPI003CE748F6
MSQLLAELSAPETDGELQQLVSQVSQEFFQKPFLHKAYFNSRLKTTGGRYHLSTHDIDFNPKVLEKYGLAELIGVIKHELCHYHLHIEGRGYQHKDPEFKKLLAVTGGSRYVQSLVDEQQFQVYRCTSCGGVIKRKRKINTQRYVCGNCRGTLKWIGK